MNIEERLNYVADRYKSRGFKVVIRPGPDDLPAFAKDFKVELVATKEDGSVLASVKATRSEFEAEPDLVRYAETIDEQPGWRFDVYVMGPDSPGAGRTRRGKGTAGGRNPAFPGQCPADTPGGVRRTGSRRRMGRVGSSDAREAAFARGKGRLGDFTPDDAQRTVLGRCHLDERPPQAREGVPVAERDRSRVFDTRR